MPTLDVAINSRKAKQGADQFDSAVKKIQRGGARVDSSVDKTDKAVGKSAGSFKNLATKIVGAAAAYKALRYSISSVKEFAAFELGLANISTMLNKQSMRYLPHYSRQIAKLAKTYGQTTDTLSKGLYDVLSASIDAGQALEVLEVSSRAAIGGMTDAGTAADAVTTILNSYGLAADQAASVSDLLFTIVKRGKITFGELAGSIGKVAALAASSGLSLEEVGSALATMTRSGIQADLAMTSLKAIITTFLSPTNESIKAARKFGFELNTTTLRTLGLTGALGLLTKATAEQRSEIFPNVRAITGLSTLMQDQAGHIGDLSLMYDRLGNSMEAYRKIEVTTSQDLKKAREYLRAFKREIGEELVMAAAGAAQLPTALDDLLGSFLNWKKQIYKPVGKIPILDIGDLVNESKENIKEYIKLLESVEQHVPGPIRQLLEAPAADPFEGFEKEAEARRRSVEKFLADTATMYEEMRLQDIKTAKELAAVKEKYLPPLVLEAKLLGMTTEERERYLAVAKYETALNKTLATGVDVLVDSYDKEIQSLQKLQAEKDAQAAVVQLFAQLKAEGELIGLTNDERERAVELLEIEAAAKVLLGDQSQKLVNEYIELLELQKQQRKEFAEMEKYYDAVGNSLANAIRSPLTAMLEDTSHISEVLKRELKNLSTDVLKMMYEDLVTKPLMDAIKNSVVPAMEGILSEIAKGLGGVVAGVAQGMGNLIGNAIAGMSAGADGLVINRYARGGILGGPTIFPMSNGGMALGGEGAGKEALMPLGTDSQGRLGVRVSGDDNPSEQVMQVFIVKDESEIEQYLDSSAGQRQIVSINKRNRIG